MDVYKRRRQIKKRMNVGLRSMRSSKSLTDAFHEISHKLCIICVLGNISQPIEYPPPINRLLGMIVKEMCRWCCSEIFRCTLAPISLCTGASKSSSQGCLEPLLDELRPSECPSRATITAPGVLSSLLELPLFLGVGWGSHNRWGTNQYYI